MKSVPGVRRSLRGRGPLRALLLGACCWAVSCSESGPRPSESSPGGEETSAGLGATSRGWFGEGQTQLRLEGWRNDSLREGSYVWRHRNGQVAIEGQYVNGQEVGRWLEWYAGGEPKSEIWWAEGDPQGFGSRWHQAGSLSTRGEFELGLPVGLHEPCYPNGQLHPEQHLAAGRLMDELLSYWENGQLQGRGSFLKGYPHGELRWKATCDLGLPPGSS